MCAGAYVSIKGGNIEFGCPGTIEFQSATQTVGGPVSMDMPMPRFRQSNYSPDSPVPKDRFVMRVQSQHDAELVSDVPYKLEIGGETFEGTVINGMINRQVNPDAKTAKVSVYLFGKDNPPKVWEVDVHAQAPEDTPEGIQSRLKNLGFYDGKLDGDLGGKSQAAIRQFRKDRNKTASTTLDEDGNNTLLSDFHNF
jgi:type VI secretion system secreted protein VgrG